MEVIVLQSRGSGKTAKMLNDALREQKKIDIDKSWTYFKDIVYSWCLEVGKDPEVYLSIEEEKYRKAMEE